MRSSLRAAALLAAGSLMVHELRYFAGYGEAGSGATAGHGYLAWLAPIVALALAGALGVWVARIGRGSSPAITWLGASTVLTGVYAVQETVEALTAGGHPGLLAHGGWVALPAAVAVGGVIALMLRGIRAADRALTRAAQPWSPPLPVACDTALPVAVPFVPRTHVIARRLAGRGPPLAS